MKQALKRSYHVDHCEQIEEAEHLISVTDYSAILLDLGLPDGSGVELCRRLRKSGITTPILIVTGEMDVEMRVTALDAGADDYLTKPFSINELSARLRSVLRRDRTNVSTELKSGGLKLDTIERRASYEGQLIRLRRKEFDLLELFMLHPNQVLSRSQIREQVWDHDSALVTNVVDVHVKCLRDQIDRPYQTGHIQTVHGIGYKFVP
jgi:DNA-binding response OmpR family regulator